jgi:hypothetical protein
MEALSPTFAAAERSAAPAADCKPCHVPVKKAALADAHAPAISVPFRFILTGLLALFAGSGLLIARPDILSAYHYSQWVIAATHLFVLGWICSVVMGAMYQLVPVALETKLFSVRLARWHFVLHVVGFIGMVAMLWVWNMKQVGHFGSAVALGAFLFVFNLGRTLARIPKWNTIAFGIASTLAWLTLTMLAGLYLASAKVWPQISLWDPLAQMHAHAHLGVLGFFVMLIVAVSYKLVPMFALSELQNSRRAGWSLALLNIALAGLAVTILLKSAWKLAFAALFLAGLAVYGTELIAILRARKRRTLDWGLKYFFTALALFLPLGALSVVLCWPTLPLNRLTYQLENVYGFLGIAGLVSLAILGMLYKIIPFLVWYASYSKEIGRAKVPSLGDLYSVKLQALGFLPLVGGVLAMAVSAGFSSAVAARWSAVVFAVGLLIYALNIGLILSHLVRRRIVPLAAPERRSPNRRDSVSSSLPRADSEIGAPTLVARR